MQCQDDSPVHKMFLYLCYGKVQCQPDSKKNLNYAFFVQNTIATQAEISENIATNGVTKVKKDKTSKENRTQKTKPLPELVLSTEKNKQPLN